jgi:hypothetical protein
MFSQVIGRERCDGLRFAEHRLAIRMRLELGLCEKLKGALAKSIRASFEGGQGLAAFAFDFLWIKSRLEQRFREEIKGRLE